MNSSYNEWNKSHRDALVDIFGPDRISTDAGDLVIESRDVYPAGELWTRRGEVRHKADCVVWPKDADEVSALLRFANEHCIPVVPYGGGSGVCGGAVPLSGGIVCDLKRMDRIRNIDDFSMSALIEAGMVGEIVERELNRRGYTIGHFPSSMYCSTVGGWIAARGAGQFSTLYGKIEDMVLALEAVLPDGSIIRSNDAPREATGPDIDQVLIGSEGTLAIITAATMKLHPLPETREYAAFVFPYITGGLEAMRLMMQREVIPSVARLYDEVDTKIALSKLNIPNEGCLLVLVFEGYRERVKWAMQEAWDIAMREGSKDLGPDPATQWEKGRYHISYRQSQVLVSPGSVLDTIETATVWSNVAELYFAVKDALDPLCFVMAHFSHIYPEGASIYFTCVAKAEDCEKDEDLYRKIWDTAMEATIKCGATVSHHHGIGYHKAAYLERQLGPLMEVYRRLKRDIDPNNILNPGKMGLINNV